MGAADTFNYVVGALAFLSTAFSFLFYFSKRLPAPQMKELDEVLEETKTILQKADSEGLLPLDFCTKMQAILQTCDESSALLRIRVYSATSTLDEYRAWLHGLSHEITQTTYRVKTVRSHLITTSERNRLQQIRENRAPATQCVGGHPVVASFDTQVPDASPLSTAPERPTGSADSLLLAGPGCDIFLSVSLEPQVTAPPETERHLGQSDFISVLQRSESSVHSTTSTLVNWWPRHWYDGFWSFLRRWREVSVKGDLESGPCNETIGME
ncbi:hypothetical protein Hypma_004590 [Hypsizygus marmoreus]|uniref:Uncharacterized protein n=1 Tax=Hypsizygus marmoreus TaxID=39966 RepID=A0A369JXS9_HYPMA|nr:hypothetical protein Hypma_004590 [Hypsizygus marmoreus]